MRSATFSLAFLLLVAVSWNSVEADLLGGLLGNLLGGGGGGALAPPPGGGGCSCGGGNGVGGLIGINANIPVATELENNCNGPCNGPCNPPSNTPTTPPPCGCQ